MEFGDRLFWAIMIFLGVMFFWLGILEANIPLWIGAISGAVFGLAFVKYGPHPEVGELERID